MVKIIVNRLLALLGVLVRILKRALCCLRRRRRPSCEPVPLTNVGIIPLVEKPVGELQSWNAWDETPTVVTDHGNRAVDPIQQHIQMYRQQRMVSESEETEQPVDFFQDMTPRITRQTKVLLQKDENDGQGARSSFSLAPDPVFNSGELGVWEETQSWEDQAQGDWDPNDALREKKRLDRERRTAEQQRKKVERDFRVGRQVASARIS